MSAARISRELADRLLTLSRELLWKFPSSSGRPVPQAAGEATLRKLVEHRERLAEVAALFIDNDESASALELAANVWRLWMMNGDIAGGRNFTTMVLERTDRAPTRARALTLYGDGLFAFWQGDVDGARTRNEAALEAARTSGDDEALALAHLGLSRAALEVDDASLAREHALEARRYARKVSEPLGQAPLHMHAQAARRAGDSDEAARLFRESLALNRRLGDSGMILVELENLGRVETHRGNTDDAEACFAECAESGPTTDAYGRAMTALNTAFVAYARSELETARATVGRIDRELWEAKIRLASDDQAELDWLRDRVASRA